jgi:DNA-binding CsgD family transcriptional regulator
MSELLGRRLECDTLNSLVASVRAGQSRVLVVRGEAGVGKSALLQYLVETATGCRIARASGVESEMELAYAGLHQLCGPMLHLRTRLPAPQCEALETAFGLNPFPAPDRFTLGLAVLGLLSEVAVDRPLVCLVDDAQWLDHASAQIIAFVGRRLDAEHVALVCAARAGSGNDILSQLPQMALGGLADADARALLLDNVYGPFDLEICDQIVAESHGNPLALLELPRTWSVLDLAGGFGLPKNQPVAGKVEQSYALRLLQLSPNTRLFVLAAAAEPSGDPLVLLRATEALGLETAAADPALDAGLLTIGGRVEFAHPLVRSAAYCSASRGDRHRVHRALAEATDPETDPDRRAWHRARASAEPDESIAVELERSASRAQARGGVAAAAAFLRRSAALTVDPVRRTERALAAAHASLAAGGFDAALGLAAIAGAGPTDSFTSARVDLLRARIAFAANRGGAVPALLLRAVKRIEPLNPHLARASYLQALAAALFAARLAAPGGGVRDVANSVQTAPPAANPPSAADLLLNGWGALFADGCVAATPVLQAALAEFDNRTTAVDELPLLWLATITAPVVWDDRRWETLTKLHVDLVRSTGALSELPLALNSRAHLHLFRGELGAAAQLVEEARVAIEATGASLTPWGALALAALRGREHEADSMFESAATDSVRRGEGIGLTVTSWARAVLYNSLGAYEKAYAAADAATACPTNSAVAVWGIPELVEAGARLDKPDAVLEHAERLAEIARTTGGDWVLGVDARTRALVSTDSNAEELYLSAVDHLRRCNMRVDLGRAHLLYGEWLRRRNRRIDARAQLRAAQESFVSIGLEAFAERARKELLATGERVRRRTPETRSDLTAQERQIAQLASEGLSNPEIGTRLFLSPRTVEWHLGKVFSKLGINSRTDLRNKLPGRAIEATLRKPATRHISGTDKAVDGVTDRNRPALKFPERTRTTSNNR